MRHFPRVFLTLSLLLPAKLFAAPIYLNASNGFPSGEQPTAWLEKRTSEVREQKWLRLKLDSKTFGWTSEDTLLTREKLTGKAFVTKASVIFSDSNHKSEALRTIEPCELVTLLGDKDEFSKVRSNNGDTGYIELANLIRSRDLGEKEALVIRDAIVLRSAPTPDSSEIRRVEKYSKFKIVESATLKWGRVDVAEKGAVWWPLDDEAIVPQKGDGVKYSSSDLFLKRKVFDMAASPLLPNLRFASANGIFRTLDDKTWEKISKFGEQNFPVAISQSGRLFVGFWYSDDQGETFHSFVRFDQLVSSLKNRWQTNPRRLKFLEVRPMNASGSELIVKVDIGLRKPVEAITRDQGVTWRAL